MGNLDIAIKGLVISEDLAVQADRLFKRERELVMLTGYSLERLVSMFAEGYELTPPKKSNSFDELAKLAE